MDVEKFIQFIDEIVNKKSNKESVDESDIFWINDAKSVLEIKRAYRENKHVCFKFNDKVIEFENPLRIIEFMKIDNSLIDKVFGEHCKFTFTEFYNKLGKVVTENDRLLNAANIITSINKDHYFICDDLACNAAFILSCAIVLYKRHDDKTTTITNNLKSISPQLYDRVVSVSSYATMFDYDEVTEKAFIFKAY